MDGGGASTVAVGRSVMSKVVTDANIGLSLFWFGKILGAVVGTSVDVITAGGFVDVGKPPIWMPPISGVGWPFGAPLGLLSLLIEGRNIPGIAGSVAMAGAFVDVGKVIWMLAIAGVGRLGAPTGLLSPLIEGRNIPGVSGKGPDAVSSSCCRRR